MVPAYQMNPWTLVLYPYISIGWMLSFWKHTAPVAVFSPSPDGRRVRPYILYAQMFMF